MSLHLSALESTPHALILPAMPARNRTLTAPPALIASRVEFGRVLQLAAVGEWLPGAELLDFLLWPQSRTTMRRHLPAAFVPGRLL